jgi:hypothetical protein
MFGVRCRLWRSVKTDSRLQSSNCSSLVLLKCTCAVQCSGYTSVPFAATIFLSYTIISIALSLKENGRTGHVLFFCHRRIISKKTVSRLHDLWFEHFFQIPPTQPDVHKCVYRHFMTSLSSAVILGLRPPHCTLREILARALNYINQSINDFLVSYTTVPTLEYQKTFSQNPCVVSLLSHSLHQNPIFSHHAVLLGPLFLTPTPVHSVY